MTLNIKSDKADRLARELAETTGESLTLAVTTALEERLARVRKRPDARDPVLEAIYERARRTPPIEPGEAERIVGYNEGGAFD